MRTPLTLTLVALLPFAGGCAFLDRVLGPPGETDPESQVASATPSSAGEEPARAEASSERDPCAHRIAPPSSDLDRRRATVLAIACGDRLDAASRKMVEETVRDIHELQQHLDDRDFDQVQFAIATTWCVSLWCKQGYTAGGRVSEGRLGAYAMHYDRAKLVDDLAALGVTDPIARTFVTQVDTRVEALGKNDPTTKSNAVPLDIVRARKAYREQHRAKFASLEAILESESDPEKRIDGLEGLRSAYLAECPLQTCWPDLFPMEVSLRLVEAHTERGDMAAAHAEHHLLMERTDTLRVAWMVLTLPRHIAGVQQLAYGRPEGPPPALELKNRAQAKVRRVKQTVAKVGPAENGWSQVTFEPRVDQWEEPYRCRRTNRVARIYPDGEVEYEENCRYRMRTKRTPYDPVTLPANEAGHLAKGDLVTAYHVDGDDKARLAVAYRDRTLVTWRMHGPG